MSCRAGSLDDSRQLAASDEQTINNRKVGCCRRKWIGNLDGGQMIFIQSSPTRLRCKHSRTASLNARQELSMETRTGKEAAGVRSICKLHTRSKMVGWEMLGWHGSLHLLSRWAAHRDEGDTHARCHGETTPTPTPALSGTSFAQRSTVKSRRGAVVAARRAGVCCTWHCRTDAGLPRPCQSRRTKMGPAGLV